MVKTILNKGNNYEANGREILTKRETGDEC